LLLGILAARPAFAVIPPGSPSPADSAGAARTAWRAAREAHFQGDRVGAMLHAERAHAAWPMQWYYALGLASLAAEAGEPTTTARALDDLAALGVGMDLTQARRSPPVAKNVIVADAAARVRVNSSPRQRNSTHRVPGPARSSRASRGTG
jgi:hypothetical protein